MAFLCGAINSTAWAATDSCPHKIGSFAHKGIFENLQSVTEKIYRDLGCDAEFVNYPTKRSMVLFNNNLLDGEIFRLELAEKDYARPFVKSAPIFEFKLGLFENKDLQQIPAYEIGYVIGIKWQEDFLKENFARFASMHRYTSVAEMLGAMVRGQLHYALSEPQTVDWFYERNTKIKKPEMVEQIGSMVAHHYLGAGFKEFIEKFDAYVRENNPYAAFGAN